MVAARQPRHSPDPVPTGLVAARPRVGSPGELGHPWVSYCNLSEHKAAWREPGQHGVATQHMDVSAGPSMVRVRPGQGTELGRSPGLGLARRCSQAGVTAPCPTWGSCPGTRASCPREMCAGAAGLGLRKRKAGPELLAAGRWDFHLYSHCS